MLCKERENFIELMTSDRELEASKEGSNEGYTGPEGLDCNPPGRRMGARELDMPRARSVLNVTTSSHTGYE